ncbi:sigma-70 family RNA polymerase sigma factor [Bacillus lacus]|uniref:Sigma-70 family RNA polymerase sigma factor n=1 Tax=Metabacillus lacus TaxID=1983721 RepID=A0A7X2M0F4_9BACI|nr:sigma-70 family RNA polymerase sigma factor [Metabacillus lacus]MRX74063.1 sigma-70 family RNA polymerase sigma factor [Metabacillus lacus]
MSIIQQLKEKQEIALVELMKLYGDYLLRTAVLLLKDRQAAEEAVQDTFLTAFEKIGQLSDENKLKSWLTCILINKCRAKMRKKSWKHAFLSLDLLERYAGDDLHSGPEESLVKLAEHQVLFEAIQQLDYKYKEAIILYYYNELKISEISAQLKLNENTVKARLARGRSLLKQLLCKGEEFGGEKNSQESAR